MHNYGKTKLILFIIFALSSADLAFTIYFMSKCGINVESNPVGKLLLSNTAYVCIYKFIIVPLCCVLLYKFRENKVAQVGILILFVVFVALTVYHFTLLTVSHKILYATRWWKLTEPVKYYNVGTTKHINLFANGILTSSRISNKYAIENMRYVGPQLISDEEEQLYILENLKRS